MKTLPVLEARRADLERCVYCPKLCRSACPVSNAEPRETITPWGKMSTASFVAHGDVPLTSSFAAPAWACTGCFGCREQCDHKNDVAGTLLDARAELLARGVAPKAAAEAPKKLAAREKATRKLARDLEGACEGKRDPKNAVLVGCEYMHSAYDAAEDAVRASSRLLGSAPSVIGACCGLPLLYAGDREGFVKQAERFALEVGAAERVLVADAGCAMALRVHYPSVGLRLSAKVELVIELAAAELGRLAKVDEGMRNETVRYHDPCQLGRGLGVYEAPRAVLGRVLGRPPAEFEERRERGGCSGGGGLLPLTMPETARVVAKGRVADHERVGGGRIVTACASSLKSFRKAGAHADDVLSLVARALPPLG